MGKKQSQGQGDIREGLVISSVGIEANVEFPGGPKLRCRQPRGREYAIVGDIARAKFNPADDAPPRIVEVLPRRSVLSRPSKRETQNIAANIDRLVVVAAVVPRLALGLIDRYLAAAEAQPGVACAIALNKIDLEGAPEALEELKIYADAGYRVLGVSAERGDGLDELLELVSSGASVLAGHSGVGKSSLLGALLPGRDIKVGEVSRATGRGRHTTTTAVAYRIGGGLVIDTPGIREFGLDVAPEGLRHLFREIDALAPGCRFGDCLHLTEPGCAVKEAAQAGDIARERYQSYLELYRELKDNPPRVVPRCERGGGCA
jgi:ribosome biogenesis GTPase